MKVLIVKTSSMGDVIHTFPAVTEALRRCPDLVFDWCVEEAFAGVARLHPGIRYVHSVALRRWRNSPFRTTTVREIRKYVHTVRDMEFDLVIDAQGLLKSAVLARIVSVPIAGFNRASARERIATLFYNRHYGVETDRHAIDRIRILFGSVLGYDPELASIDYGLKRIESKGAVLQSVFLLHGTTWSSKKWHTEGWIALAKELVRRNFTPLVTFHGAEEKAVAERIVAAVPQTQLVVVDDVAELADILARSAGVVGTDTGLTHLACALDLPTVQIALSTRPQLTGPRGNRVGVVSASTACAPCKRSRCVLVPTGQIQPCTQTVQASQIMTMLSRLVPAGTADP